MKIFRRLVIAFLFIPVTGVVVAEEGTRESGIEKTDETVADQCLVVFNEALEKMSDFLVGKVDHASINDEILLIKSKLSKSKLSKDSDLNSSDLNSSDLESSIFDLIGKIENVVRPLVIAVGEKEDFEAINERKVNALTFLQDENTRNIVISVISKSQSYGADVLHNFDSFVQTVETGKELRKRELGSTKTQPEIKDEAENKEEVKEVGVEIIEVEEVIDETSKLNVEAATDILKSFVNVVDGVQAIQEGVLLEDQLVKVVKDLKAFGELHPVSPDLLSPDFLGEIDFGYENLKNYISQNKITPTGLVTLWICNVSTYLGIFMDEIRAKNRTDKIKLFNLLDRLNSVYFLVSTDNRSKYYNSFIDNVRLLLNEETPGNGDLFVKSVEKLISGIGNLYDKYRSKVSKSFSYWQENWLKHRSKGEDK